MKKFWLPALLMAWFAFGCGPDRINHKCRFYGHAQDKFTRYPVGNADISISMDWNNFGGSTSRSSYENLGTTNENGDYDFEARHIVKDKDAFNCIMYFNGRGVNYMYYSNQWAFDAEDNWKNQVDAELYTLCRWRIRFINSTPFDANDRVSNIYIDRPWGQQKFVEGDPEFLGTAVNSEIWTTYYGYSTSVLHYTVTKNSVSQSYADTLVVSDPLDGVLYADTIAY